MNKLVDKGHMWFFGIIPLVVGILFVARDFGVAFLPVEMGLWNTMVFLWGLVYVLLSLGK